MNVYLIEIQIWIYKSWFVKQYDKNFQINGLIPHQESVNLNLNQYFLNRDWNQYMLKSKVKKRNRYINRHAKGRFNNTHPRQSPNVARHRSGFYTSPPHPHTHIYTTRLHSVSIPQNRLPTSNSTSFSLLFLSDLFFPHPHSLHLAIRSVCKTLAPKSFRIQPKAPNFSPHWVGIGFLYSKARNFIWRSNGWDF